MALSAWGELNWGEAHWGGVGVDTTVPVGIKGWGASSWNTGTWNTNNAGDIGLSVGSGTLSFVANANVLVSGNSLQLNIGTASLVGEANADATGSGLSVGVGTAVAKAGATVAVTGVESQVSVGTVTFDTDAVVVPTGQSVEVESGTLSFSGDANFAVTGSSVTASVGTPIIALPTIFVPTGSNVPVASGTASIAADANVAVTGSDLSVGTGTLDASGDSTVVIENPTGTLFSANGDAQLSTAQKKFGTASLLLDGTGDFVKSTNTDVVNGNFTIEFFVYSDDFLQDAYLWDNQVSNSGLAIALTSLGRLRVLKDNTIVLNVTSGLSNDSWNHVALVQNGNFLTIYVNGSSRGQYLQTSASDYSGQPYYIGCRHTEADFFDGYIDELRASSVARYSGTFTPTTTPFTLDDDTTALVHFDGDNGSTEIINEVSNKSFALEVQTNAPTTRSAYLVTGNQASVSTGSVSFTIDAVVLPVGSSLTLEVNDLIITTWNSVSTGDTQTWTPLSTGDSQTWTDVPTNDNQTWTPVPTNDNQEWTDVPTNDNEEWYKEVA